MAHGSQLTVQPPVHALDVAVGVTDLTKMEQAELDAFTVSSFNKASSGAEEFSAACHEQVFRLPKAPGARNDLSGVKQGLRAKLEELGININTWFPRARRAQK